MKKWNVKCDYDKRIELEKQARQKFTPVAEKKKTSTLNKGDEEKERKMQVNTKFIRKNYFQYPSLLDNKQRVIE